MNPMPSRRRTIALAVAATAVVATACGAPERDTTLVVHSPLPGEAVNAAIEIFERDFERVDVRVVEATAEETVAALRSGEAIDVWWGAPGVEMEVAADDGLLQMYAPPWLRQPGIGLVDPEGRWQVAMISPFVVAFNRENVPLAEAPADWSDLFHQQWTGEVALVDPDQSPEMAHFVSAMIVDGLRSSGGDFHVGFEWLGRLEASVGTYVSDAETAIRMLGDGGALLTVLPRYVVEEARHGDAPWIHYRLPEGGTPMLEIGVAVGANAAQVDLARTFVDLVGTIEVGTAVRRVNRWMPAYGNVATDQLPPDFEIDMQWRPLQPAPDTIARFRDEWVERFGLEVRGRS